MSAADTLRVLNRTVERLNEAEGALLAASWERMCLLAALYRSRDLTRMCRVNDMIDLDNIVQGMQQ